VRWDKNFLTLLHLLLARRDKLRIYGGIRFGGTLPIEDAWAHGFDHIAIAAGAGKPTVIDMKHNLVRGVRKASDFLMALQLTGAFKRNALPNLQARLPAIVIGGGLTGIDTATELFAYYPIQVEKTLERYEALCAEQGENVVRGRLRRGRAGDSRRVPRARPRRPGRARARRGGGRGADFVPLVRGWGGVTLAYRKKMTDSPAYRLNHEEVIKALEEGITSPRGSTRRRSWPTTTITSWRCGSRSERPRRAAGAHGARRGRHVAQRILREGEGPAPSSSTRSSASSRASAPSA
jgi:NADPH-dependent glutamate synthase beta subunit-like oxidoreductase